MRFISLAISFTIIIIYCMIGCYTKPKIDLSKLGDTYEICGTWYRGGGFIRDKKGPVRAFKIDYLLTISDDGSYRYKCNERQSVGRFRVVKDTVIFISSPHKQSRYLYNLEGHTLTFTKLDSNNEATCAILEKEMPLLASGNINS